MENEYVTAPIEFRNKHGSKYNTVIRAKIKRKVTQATADLLKILDADNKILDEFKVEEEFYNGGQRLNYRFKRVLGDFSGDRIGQPRSIAHTDIAKFVFLYLKKYKPEYDRTRQRLEQEEV